MAYQLLKGRKGLIFGALNDKSIAWKVAELAVAEGADIVLTNTPVSIRLGEINRLAEQCGTVVIPADATSVTDLEALVDGPWNTSEGNSTSSSMLSPCLPTSAKAGLIRT